MHEYLNSIMLVNIFMSSFLSILSPLPLLLSSSDCIAFTTEPVIASLANVLGYYANLPSPLPLDIKVNNNALLLS